MNLNIKSIFRFFLKKESYSVSVCPLRYNTHLTSKHPTIVWLNDLTVWTWDSSLGVCLCTFPHYISPLKPHLPSKLQMYEQNKGLKKLFVIFQSSLTCSDPIVFYSLALPFKRMKNSRFQLTWQLGIKFYKNAVIDINNSLFMLLVSSTWAAGAGLW